MIYRQTSFEITVEAKVSYVPQDQHNGGDTVYLWAYHISLHNQGEVAARLKTRHWEIMDSLGRMQIVDGPGVVGETPLLKSGERFAYSSSCPLSTTSGTMSGFYMFETENKEALKIIVPPLSLDLPQNRRLLN
jgi:ApaG protein